MSGDDEARLHQTEMLIRIFRPVMEYHGAWEPEVDDGGEPETRGFQPEDRPPVLKDLALSAQYPEDPQLEAIASQARWNRDPVRLLKSLHVLHRMQETWLVKFTAEVSAHDTWLSAHDTWGRALLNKLQGFDDELQKLTSYIHTCVTSTPMVSAGQYDDESPSHLWDNTAMKFVCLLLFLFDVGITPEAEQYEYYDDARFHESPAFCGSSVFRSRILADAAFITHLELCAWKVLTVSWGIRNPYEWHKLAIPGVCAELRVRIVAIRQEYAVKINTDRRQSAIKDMSEGREPTLEQNLTGLRETVYHFRRFCHEHVRIDYMYMDSENYNAMSNIIDRLLGDIARAFWGRWKNRTPVPHPFSNGADEWYEDKEEEWAQLFERCRPFEIPYEIPCVSPPIADLVMFVKRLQYVSEDCETRYQDYVEDCHDRHFSDTDTHENVMGYLIAIESLINVIHHQMLDLSKLSKT
jgi:hypothetical protein